MFLIVLLIIFLGFYLLQRFLPQILVWYMRRKVQSQMRSAFGSQQQEPRQKQRPWWRSASSQSKPRKRRQGKIIPNDVGEYVEFEEIKVYSQSSTTTTDGDGARRQYVEEAQVTDAEWEEIK